MPWLGAMIREVLPEMRNLHSRSVLTFKFFRHHHILRHPPIAPRTESIRVSLGPSVIDTTLSSPQPQNQRSDPALLEEHRNRLFNEYVFQSIIK